MQKPQTIPVHLTYSGITALLSKVRETPLARDREGAPRLQTLDLLDAMDELERARAAR
jgi:hypothetical protein